MINNCTFFPEGNWTECCASGSDKGSSMHWKVVTPVVIDGLKQMFKCTCGATKMVNISNVKRSKSTSCGCKGKPAVPPELRRVFTLIKYRCRTETSPDYCNWGAKGIKVLYTSAYELYLDIGDMPSKLHSIDRIDGTSHYMKGNCRWATAKEQANNISSNRVLCCNGETRNLCEWASLIGINPSTIRYRLDKGMSIEDSLYTPVDKKKSEAGKISQESRLLNGYYK